jgi:hypothetical protein
MFGIASRSNPSARTVSTHTSTERSFGYVASSGDRRRSQATCALPGTSARSGPRSRSNQRSRSPDVLLGDGVRRPAQHVLELSQGDLLLGLVAGDGVAVARELGLEVVAGDEELAAPLVEASVELPHQLAELVSLPVLRDDGEPRLRRPQRHLLAVEGQPGCENRVLELVLAGGRARPRRCRTRTSCAAGRAVPDRRRQLLPPRPRAGLRADPG